MYKEKMLEILSNIENKELDVAGGSVVGMSLATINSLIKYISNLTLGKKKYEDVDVEVKKILGEAEELKKQALDIIDEDSKVLDKILMTYKTRNQEENAYLRACKDGVEFCMHVLEIAFETLKLSDRISKVGNRMLASDFKICKYYAFASIKSAIVNVDINLKSIKDEEYKEKTKQRYTEILEKSRSYIE